MSFSSPRVTAATPQKAQDDEPPRDQQARPPNHRRVALNDRVETLHEGRLQRRRRRVQHFRLDVQRWGRRRRRRRRLDYLLFGAPRWGRWRPSRGWWWWGRGRRGWREGIECLGGVVVEAEAEKIESNSEMWGEWGVTYGRNGLSGWRNKTPAELAVASRTVARAGCFLTPCLDQKDTKAQTRTSQKVTFVALRSD